MWFDHAKGLMAKGGELTGFEVAGADGKFVPATAAIEGNGGGDERIGGGAGVCALRLGQQPAVQSVQWRGAAGFTVQVGEVGAVVSE